MRESGRPARSWWRVLVQGVAVLALGLMLLIAPAASAVILYTLLGVFLLISGIGSIADGISGRSGRSRTWLLVGGFLSAVGGLVAVLNPVLGTVIATSAVAYVVALAAILNGALQLTGLRTRDHQGNERISWSALFQAVIKTGIGVLVILNPFFSGLLVLQIIGVWGAVGGAVLLLQSWRLRRIESNPKSA